MPTTDWTNAWQALRDLKRAIGLPDNFPLQKVVLEFDGLKMPTVYIKGVATRAVVTTAIGLVAVEPVADVVVSDQGEVQATPIDKPADGPLVPTDPHPTYLCAGCRRPMRDNTRSLCVTCFATSSALRR